MKKFLFLVLALLLVCGSANAAGIPTGVDPKNAPEIWTAEVYNNAGSALTSGTVVVWGMSADTSDASYAYRTMWVTTTSTNDDINVAGVVVDPSIAAGDVGTIAIWGPVYTRVADSSDAVTADQIVGCANGVTGQAGEYGTANNSGILGWCIYASGVAIANGGYGATDGVDNIMMPIFVDPHVAD